MSFLYLVLLNSYVFEGIMGFVDCAVAEEPEESGVFGVLYVLQNRLNLRSSDRRIQNMNTFRDLVIAKSIFHCCLTVVRRGSGEFVLFDIGDLLIRKDYSLYKG